jgi:hypothetical protein
MKALFYLGIVGLILFEIANVYFIMPLPGSQRMRSIDLAYWLYTWRWAFRIGFGLLALAGVVAAWRAKGWRKWLVPGLIVLVGVAAYATNYEMAADTMFYQPETLAFKPARQNKVDLRRLVVGVELNGQAKAYPIQFIGYHHQVRDTVGGRPVLVSYCTVCRTGRVFSPFVDGEPETFRLVGMDHFNAMFEDETTGSWWRQANGEAIVGPRKGALLPELPSEQMTLRQWLRLHPASLVMQADPAFKESYPKDFKYENGTSRKELTGTDSLSWRDKSWVVGLTVGRTSRAYDWNDLLRQRIIHDTLGGKPVVLVLASDRASFVAFERPDANTRFGLRRDSLVAPGGSYAFSGVGPTGRLRKVPASQEFWHSWRTFHPATSRYQP